jgi:hypothetical protein
MQLVQDDRGSHHRACQRATARLVDPGNQACHLPLQGNLLHADWRMGTALGWMR